MLALFGVGFDQTKTLSARYEYITINNGACDEHFFTLQLEIKP